MLTGKLESSVMILKSDLCAQAAQSAVKALHADEAAGLSCLSGQRGSCPAPPGPLSPHLVLCLQKNYSEWVSLSGAWDEPAFIHIVMTTGRKSLHQVWGDPRRRETRGWSLGTLPKRTGRCRPGGAAQTQQPHSRSPQENCTQE